MSKTGYAVAIKELKSLIEKKNAEERTSRTKRKRIVYDSYEIKYPTKVVKTSLNL
jgi:hypothetical protein